MTEDGNHSREASSERPAASLITDVVGARSSRRPRRARLLIARYLPRLQRWATGRLPRWARDMADTQDLVQEALFQTFKRIERFEASRRRGSAGLPAPGHPESDPGGASPHEATAADNRARFSGGGSRPISARRSDRTAKRSSATSGRLRDCDRRIASLWSRELNSVTRTARLPSSWTSRRRMPHAWPRSAPSFGSPRRWKRRRRDAGRTCPARRCGRDTRRRPDRLGVRRVERRRRVDAENRPRIESDRRDR